MFFQHKIINVGCLFVDEYSLLLEKFQKVKGSLKMASLNSQADKSCTVTPLPPVVESTFTKQQVDDIKILLSSILQENCNIAILHNQAKAIMIGDNVFGAHNCRHSHSSFVLAERIDGSDVNLAIIHSFVESTVVIGMDDKFTRWFAIVSWFEPHQCRVWFGYPVEVWCTVSFNEYNLIPLSNIKYRVVCTKANYKFGSVIGEDTVYVTAPIY